MDRETVIEVNRERREFHDTLVDIVFENISEEGSLHDLVKDQRPIVQVSPVQQLVAYQSDILGTYDVNGEEILVDIDVKSSSHRKSNRSLGKKRLKGTLMHATSFLNYHSERGEPAVSLKAVYSKAAGTFHFSLLRPREVELAPEVVQTGKFLAERFNAIYSQDNVA